MERNSQKRPWLAALFGLVTGAGHLYLRRWKRAVGWIGLSFATSLLVVDPAALQAFYEGTGPIEPVLPVLVVGFASLFDAYFLARAQNEAARRTVDADGTITHCPHCGKELDGDVDFCPWCTTELDEFRVASPADSAFDSDSDADARE
ncbi:zinc ribbon domain-containing protein [Halogeometricum sp. S1BR25-6]|uniref:Zinc ribbon domain-containing protein n=1 Tax=Halogeometricum salsisoli TaxID=2950536 RepID=A0ABU2GAG9_9EURY|nr:zinc ribbon domain-containing protein [Halogeometricum sp. S1BR25-6]MDS0297812.1 zinc ribbon domain-containing protein [Halogeometricum sp. S1BR25-6]